MLVCYRTRRRVGGWLDGALAEGATQAVESHLAACSRCQQEAEVLRRLRRAIRQNASAGPVPDWTDFWAGVARGVEERRAAPPRLRRAGWSGRVLARPRLAVGGAVALALLLTVGLWQAFRVPAAPAVVIRSAHTEHPGGTVMVYAPPEQDLALVWVFGLD